MKKESNQESSVFSAIISIAIPLIQLFAVSSAALSSQLNLTQTFVKSEILPLVNIFVIFITLSIIGISRMRQNNFWGFRKGKGLSLIDEKQYQIEKIGNALWFLQIPSFFILLLVILLPSPDQNIKAFLQYAFYTVFLVTSGIILFWWMQDYIRKKNQPKQDDFIPNLLDSLRKHKLLKENPVEILDQVVTENSKKLVRIKIEGQTEYFLVTDFFGLKIENTWDKSNVPNKVREYLIGGNISD